MEYSGFLVVFWGGIFWSPIPHTLFQIKSFPQQSCPPVLPLYLGKTSVLLHWGQVRWPASSKAIPASGNWKGLQLPSSVLVPPWMELLPCEGDLRIRVATEVPVLPCLGYSFHPMNLHSEWGKESQSFLPWTKASVTQRYLGLRDVCDFLSWDETGVLIGSCG